MQPAGCEQTSHLDKRRQRPPALTTCFDFSFRQSPCQQVTQHRGAPGSSSYLGQPQDTPQRPPHVPQLSAPHHLLVLQLAQVVQAPLPAVPARLRQPWGEDRSVAGPLLCRDVPRPPDEGSSTKNSTKTQPPRAQPHPEHPLHPLTVGVVGGSQVGRGAAVHDGVGC